MITKFGYDFVKKDKNSVRKQKYANIQKRNIFKKQQNYEFVILLNYMTKFITFA